MTIDFEYLQALVKEGRQAEALKVAVLLFKTSLSNPHLWYETAKLCHAMGEKKAGADGIAAVCREFVESGNLPMAIVCIKDIEDLGDDATGLAAAELKALAAAVYGKGAARVKDRAMPVPPLPLAVDEALVGREKPDRAALLAEARTLLTLAEESAKMAAGTAGRRGDVPYFPLFGALSAQHFGLLIDCFSTKRFFKDDILIRQGEVARELYILAKGEVRVSVIEKAKDDLGSTRQVKYTHLATLGPGTFVGEMGMVARTPRSATVQALTSGILISAALDTIEELSSEIPELVNVIVAFCETRLLENVMATSPILTPVRKEERVEVLRAFDRRYLPAGETLIREGEPAQGLAIVVSGELGVTRLEKGRAPKGEGADPRASTDRIVFITTLGAGEVTGEISTVMKKPATATVHAVTDASLLFLPVDRFLDFTKRWPEVFGKLYEIVTQREGEIDRIAKAATSSADDLVE